MLSSRRLREKQALFATLHKVMGAMKAMAFAEMNRLQQQMVSEQVCLMRYQQAMRALLAGTEPAQQLRRSNTTEIVIGTERGFCGEINRRLADYVSQDVPSDHTLLLIGERLHQSVSGRAFKRFSGAQSGEGIEAVVDALFEYWQGADGTPDSSDLRVTYWDDTHHQVATLTALMPLAAAVGEPLNETSPDDYTPACYLPREVLRRELEPDLVFALLHCAVKMALLSENRQRVSHLDAATRHLKDKNENLRVQANQLRQSNIISEVEALLSVQEGLA
ncbi:MAG: F0F1 ATP synthase subunit gamma [Hahellaceae bacterium]|nr:F0F1 ATP synthase subunit gamma [Hahellaceae bacterium]